MRAEKSEPAAADAEGRFRRLVYEDPLGRLELAKATRKHFDDWRKRTLETGTRGSFNRNATPLRAAMNRAHDNGLVASTHAWRAALKAFNNADGRRELYLHRDARLQLLNKASLEAQRFIRSLLLLPFRPGDGAKLKVEHFHDHQRSLSIPTGKTKPRVVPLSSEAVAHFRACAKGKLPGAWLVARDDGRPWNKDSWADAIDAAAAAARPVSRTAARAYCGRRAPLAHLDASRAPARRSVRKAKPASCTSSTVTD